MPEPYEGVTHGVRPSMAAWPDRCRAATATGDPHGKPPLVGLEVGGAHATLARSASKSKGCEGGKSRGFERGIVGADDDAADDGRGGTSRLLRLRAGSSASAIYGVLSSALVSSDTAAFAVVDTDDDVLAATSAAPPD